MWKSIAIAFSLYSAIPMPQFPWEKKEMESMLLYFPWIGAVIGSFLYGWFLFCQKFEVGSFCYACIGSAIPLLMTGGFHMDGFLDTMDAFHSYQDRGRKLEILKDSHVGAFAVIMAALYGLIYVGAFSEIRQSRTMLVYCGAFFFTRALSGIGVVSFRRAKQDGMVSMFATQANQKRVQVGLLGQSVLCAGWMIWIDLAVGMLLVSGGLATFGYYWWKTKKELGGITGDTAGYFVLLCEEVMLVSAAIFEILL